MQYKVILVRKPICQFSSHYQTVTLVPPLAHSSGISEKAEFGFWAPDFPFSETWHWPCYSWRCGASLGSWHLSRRPETVFRFPLISTGRRAKVSWNPVFSRDPNSSCKSMAHGEDTEQDSDIYSQSHDQNVSLKWHSPTPCFPKLSPITALVLLSSDICCHQAQELKGGTEDCKILWHVLCQCNGERTWHNWSVFLCWLLCWLPKETTAQWRNRQILRAAQDKLLLFIFFPWHWHKYLLCCVFNSFPPPKLPSAESR